MHPLSLAAWRTVARRGVRRVDIPPSGLPFACRPLSLRLSPLSSSPPSASAPPLPPLPPGKRLLVVSAQDGHMRLDRWLKSHLHATVHAPISLLEKMCRSRQIQLLQPEGVATEAGTPAVRPTKLSGNYRVQAGQRILLPEWLLTEQRNGAGSGSARSLPPPPPLPTPARTSLSPAELQQLRQRVLYEDEHLLVLNKPAGLPVHAGTGNTSRHLTGMLWALEIHPAVSSAASASHTAAASSSPVPAASASPSIPFPSSSSLRLVHRLDKETSGCLLLAKDRHTAELITNLLKKPAEESAAGEQGSQQQQQEEAAAAPAVQHHIRTDLSAPLASTRPTYSPAVWSVPPAGSETTPFVQKRYLAVVHGIPQQNEGSLFSATSTGSLSHSSYRVLASTSSSSSPSFSLLEFIPHTGRKRQLRLHCHMELGCSIVGEQVHMLTEESSGSVGSSTASSSSWQQRYQAEREAPIRTKLQLSSSTPLPLFLHARQLLLQHPTLHQGRLLQVQAPLPPQFEKLVREMFRWQP